MTEFELERAFLAAWGEMVTAIKEARSKTDKRFDEIFQEGVNAGIPQTVLEKVVERVTQSASAEADQIARDEAA